MRITLEDWKRDWIKDNGETDGTEVLVSEGVDSSESYIYEGSFKNIPKELLDRKVVNVAKVIESTIPERNGAYSLIIE